MTPEAKREVTVVGLAAVACAIVTFGVNQLFNAPALAERVAELKFRFDQHATVVEIAQQTQLQDNTTRIAVMQTELAAIKMQLEDLKRGQDELLRKARK